MNNIKENLFILLQKIDAAARRSGRTGQDIKLVIVTKTIPAAVIEEVIQSGITDLGENRVQEAKNKFTSLCQKYPQITLHMLGHLQRNKVRQALDSFAIIQSLDSLALAQELQKKATQKIPVFIEVKTSDEPNKHGVLPDETLGLLEKIAGLSNLRVKGLMTVAPIVRDPDLARPAFIKLRKLKEQIQLLQLPGVDIQYLSMGMSDDFEIAIEEGSNLVRIGRAVFGYRS